MNRAFWKGKKVFLTGHTGFKGAWMALWLERLGAQVTGYALGSPTRPSLFEWAVVANGMHTITGDLLDAEVLRAALQASGAEIVIHMAAQSLVRYSYDAPAETFATNVMGTIHLLEAIRQTPGIRTVVNITTDKCYENTEQLWSYREIDPLGGHDPYSSSKACSEIVSAAYRRSFFKANHIHLATARAGNVIGGGDWAKDRLIPDVIEAFSKGQPVRIRNPHAVRPWQHVLEPLSGYLLLAEKLYGEGEPYAESWNFGPYEHEALPVSQVVERLAQVWGPDAAWSADKGPHPHEASLLKLNCSKAHEKLGWRPQLDMSTALEWTVNWYRRVLSTPELARSACLQQIEQYEALLEKDVEQPRKVLV